MYEKNQRVKPVLDEETNMLKHRLQKIKNIYN